MVVYGEKAFWATGLFFVAVQWMATEIAAGLSGGALSDLLILTMGNILPKDFLQALCTISRLSCKMAEGKCSVPGSK